MLKPGSVVIVRGEHKIVIEHCHGTLWHISSSGRNDYNDLECINSSNLEEIDPFVVWVQDVLNQSSPS